MGDRIVTGLGLFHLGNILLLFGFIFFGLVLSIFMAAHNQDSGVLGSAQHLEFVPLDFLPYIVLPWLVMQCTLWVLV